MSLREMIMSHIKLSIAKNLTESEANDFASKLSIGYEVVESEGEAPKNWTVMALVERSVIETDEKIAESTNKVRQVVLDEDKLVIASNQNKLILGVSVEVDGELTRSQAANMIQGTYFDEIGAVGNFRLDTGRKDLFCEQFILNGTVGGNNVQKDSVGMDIYEAAIQVSNGKTTISFLQFIEFEHSNLGKELNSTSIELTTFMQCIDGQVTQLDLSSFASRSNIFEEPYYD